MVFLYNIGIALYVAAVRVASLWNGKARQWVEGRKNVFAGLETRLSPTDRWIWMHCSSAGEFEQGKPVIEALKAAYPGHKLLVSFFSPSGYAVAKNYAHADCICYLPVDTRANAKRFLQTVNPELALFVKYEFWYHLLSEAAFRHVPVLLVSATFRPNQVFFKSYGGFFRRMLFLFRHIFVQDTVSEKLLKENGVAHCSTSGDTRFDRVAAIAQSGKTIPAIEKFLQGSHCLVAGSTWGDDEKLLQEFWGEAKHSGLKLIIAPHEIGQTHLQEIKALFPEAVFFSSLKEDEPQSADVLVIDNVGMLSTLYKYASLTYVGGGFTRDGIHNVLEAAVWGKPVIFGPNHKKYREAGELIEAGGGFSINNATELKKLAGSLLANEGDRQAVGLKARNYVVENTGATQAVLRFVQENRLLTRP